ncbi:MAG: hypothetical protein JKY67_17060 [Pseudomonadales bacterium]|nr:hypothetical protein [Pseudomonadales bacterium]
MTKARKQLVSISDTPYYHVVSRCVRRAFLCGSDSLTDKNYDHMHLIIKLNPSDVESLSAAQIIERWTCLYKGPTLIQRWCANETLCPAELQSVTDCVEVYRHRLTDLSWFMKCLNEPIARQANKEDNCTGHFWESRFKSQALLSEEALLSCMTYVDLNPVRAKMARTPEESSHTSIKERINPSFQLSRAIEEQTEQNILLHFNQVLKPLATFEGAVKNTEQNGILFSLHDYLELVDYTGRIICPDKRGAIPINMPSILQRIQLDKTSWLRNATEFERIYVGRFGKARRRKELANTG